MTQELLYTSAPRGLKPGSRGFCTVLSTRGMSAPLAAALESLSGYRAVFPHGDVRARENPVVRSHVRLSVAGQTYSVLSRISDYGLDYSQRANKIAHHLVLDPEERVAEGPAAVLSAHGMLEATWSGEPRVISAGRKVTAFAAPMASCHAWKAATGDPGWAGVLAESFLADSSRQAYLVYPPELDMLPLLVEAIGLLPEHVRWDVTFSTYYTSLPPAAMCQWRFVLAGSPEAHQSQRFVQALRIDLTQALGKARGGELVEAARTGRRVEVPRPAGTGRESEAAVHTGAVPEVVPEGEAGATPSLPPALEARPPRPVSPEHEGAMVPLIVPPHPAGRRRRTLSDVEDRPRRRVPLALLVLSAVAVLVLVAAGAIWTWGPREEMRRLAGMVATRGGRAHGESDAPEAGQEGASRGASTRIERGAESGKGELAGKGVEALVRGESDSAASKPKTDVAAPTTKVAADAAANEGAGKKRDEVRSESKGAVGKGNAIAHKEAGGPPKRSRVKQGKAAGSEPSSPEQVAAKGQGGGDSSKLAAEKVVGTSGDEKPVVETSGEKVVAKVAEVVEEGTPASEEVAESAGKAREPRFVFVGLPDYGASGGDTEPIWSGKLSGAKEAFTMSLAMPTVAGTVLRVSESDPGMGQELFVNVHATVGDLCMASFRSALGDANIVEVRCTWTNQGRQHRKHLKDCVLVMRCGEMNERLVLHEQPEVGKVPTTVIEPKGNLTWNLNRILPTNAETVRVEQVSFEFNGRVYRFEPKGEGNALNAKGISLLCDAFLPELKSFGGLGPCTVKLVRGESEAIAVALALPEGELVRQDLEDTFAYLNGSVNTIRMIVGRYPLKPSFVQPGSEVDSSSKLFAFLEKDGTLGKLQGYKSQLEERLVDDAAELTQGARALRPQPGIAGAIQKLDEVIERLQHFLELAPYEHYPHWRNEGKLVSAFIYYEVQDTEDGTNKLKVPIVDIREGDDVPADAAAPN